MLRVLCKYPERVGRWSSRAYVTGIWSDDLLKSVGNLNTLMRLRLTLHCKCQRDWLRPTPIKPKLCQLLEVVHALRGLGAEVDSPGVVSATSLSNLSKSVRGTAGDDVVKEAKQVTGRFS